MRIVTCAVLAALVAAAGSETNAAEEALRDDETLQRRIQALEQELQNLKQLVNQEDTTPKAGPKFHELDQKIRVLERKQKLEQEAAVAKAKATPIVSVGSKGFSLESAEGDFKLRLRALVQADSRFYINDGGVPANDTFLIRRARLEFTGNLYQDFEYRVMPDFAGATPTLLDAWLLWKIDSAFAIQAGKVKQPIGLERFQTRENNLFTEFGYPTALVPNRDIGVNIQGRVLDGALDYYLGVFDDTPDGGSVVVDTDDEKSIAARLFAHPFAKSDIAGLQGLGFGLAGTYGIIDGTPGGYSSVGQQVFYSWKAGVANDGTRWRLVPQAYYFNGPFGLLAEYAVSSQKVKLGATAGTINNSAWQMTVSYVLTGEDATFKGVKPQKNVSLGHGGGWGAWQVVARVTQLDIDDGAFPTFGTATSSSKATSYGGGLNWYLNPQVRISLDYNLTDFDGASRFDEHAMITRFQYRF